MNKIIRVILIAFSLAMVICISDNIINLGELSKSSGIGEIFEIIFYTEIMGLGLFFILKFVDVAILDRFSKLSNITRYEVYSFVSLVYTGLFVQIYTKSYIGKLPAEKLANEIYVNSLYVRAYVAGFLYLMYGLIIFILIEWLNNRIMLKKFKER